MAKLTFAELQELITNRFGDNLVLQSHADALQPFLCIAVEGIADICQFLHENEQTYFDFLACITAIDNGSEKATIDVLYHLYSIPYEHSLVLKVILPRSNSTENLPQIPTVSHIWQTANWHERESFDLMGIHFTNHPDLRRILLPEDWHGHPLRKDYQAQETYHGIQVSYE